jgi:hypothetical protein
MRNVSLRWFVAPTTKQFFSFYLTCCACVRACVRVCACCLQATLARMLEQHKEEQQKFEAGTVTIPGGQHLTLEFRRMTMWCTERNSMVWLCLLLFRLLLGWLLCSVSRAGCSEGFSLEQGGPAGSTSKVPTYLLVVVPTYYCAWRIWAVVL